MRAGVPDRWDGEGRSGWLHLPLPVSDRGFRPRGSAHLQRGSDLSRGRRKEREEERGEMPQPLSYLDPIITRNCGARAEGDVFSVLKHSRYVVRSFEFGAADGAIDCSEEHDQDTSFAERFQRLRRQEPLSRRLLLFDIKSTTASDASQQRFGSFPQQKAVAAFYICVSTTDPAYVDLLPNYDQSADVLESGVYFAAQVPTNAAERTAITWNRACWLPAISYGFLDPSSTPYRMPRWMLPEAISRIRRCVLSGEPYVNPWSRVAFPEWAPITTAYLRWIEPSEETAQFTAYEQVMHIMRAVQSKSSYKFDFVGLQPRLGDFKMDDVVIQHKVSTTEKRVDTASAFEAVQIARGDPGKRNFYFHAFERFHFFMYQFEFSGTPQQRGFFFIPESAFHDRFYTTLDRLASFSHFYDEYFVHIDEEMAWVRKMEEVIARHPQPRAAHWRPVRELTTEELLLGEGEEQDGSPPPPVPGDARRAAVPGRREYIEMLRLGLRQFYHGVMMECALRGSGILIVLSRHYGVCDLAFCRYSWTGAEQQCFLKDGRPPQTAHSLPPPTACVPICFFARERECSFQGPSLTAPQYRRLDASSFARLLVFDIGGRDALGHPLLPAIIPSEDVSFTTDQRQIFMENLAKDRAAGEWTQKAPNVSGALSTGLFASEYAPAGGGGPAEYGNPASYTPVWKVLDRFSLPHPMEHPRGFWREAASHQLTLQSVNQFIADQHFESRTSAAATAEDDMMEE